MSEIEKAPAASDRAVEPAPSDDAPAPWWVRNRELLRAALAALLLAVACLGGRGAWMPRPLALGLYATVYVLAGWDLLRHAASDLRKGRMPLDVDLLMLVAALGAATLGEFAEGGFLLVLFAGAHALEHAATERSRRAIRGLADLAPTTARVRRGTAIVEVPLSEVRVGDLLQVRPGERLPVDGVVRSGTSAVDQAPITGESVPVDKEIGASVFAGTINGEGSLDVEATAVSGDRTLDRMVRIVEEAQAQKAPTQLFTEKFERIFVPTVLVVVLLIITVGPLLGIWSWSVAFYRGMTLLVAASPCALALGTPSAVLAGIARAARGGMLIKGGRPLENLGGVKAMAFDKTGTLTIGCPEVTDLLPLEGSTEADLLRMAAAVEVHSQHPLARAVLRRAERDALPWPAATDVQSLTARGMRASVEGVTVEVGATRLWSEAGIALPADVQAAVQRLMTAARSVIIVRAGERWMGVLGVADQLRPEAPDVMAQLRRLGVSPLVMLTGDNAAVGNVIGSAVGVDLVEADLLPESKLERIQALLKTHGNVAMVGDGVNDAPALAYATVGIAMGGAGTAVALETADVALMADDLTTLPRAVELARATRAIIRQNLALSLGVITLLIVGTLTGRVTIGLAVVGHEGSTLLVMMNALRLLRFGRWSSSRAVPRL